MKNYNTHLNQQHDTFKLISNQTRFHSLKPSRVRKQLLHPFYYLLLPRTMIRPFVLVLYRHLGLQCDEVLSAYFEDEEGIEGLYISNKSLKRDKAMMDHGVRWTEDSFPCLGPLERNHTRMRVRLLWARIESESSRHVERYRTERMFGRPGS